MYDFLLIVDFVFARDFFCMVVVLTVVVSMFLYFVYRTFPSVILDIFCCVFFFGLSNVHSLFACFSLCCHILCSYVYSVGFFCCHVVDPHHVGQCIVGLWLWCGFMYRLQASCRGRLLSCF